MRLVLLPALLLAAPALAQDPAHDPACSNVRVAFPPELAGWSQQAPLAAGRDGRGAGVVGVGRAVALKLQPAASVGLVTPSLKEPAAGSYAGLVRFEVAQAGRYRVALGGGAWVDVVANGSAQETAAHGHGPACTGIRKTVDFDLKPGRYLIQLKDAKTATLPLMVAKL
jgi:hypothetical protein